MVKETHTKGGYLFAILFIPFILDSLSKVNNIIYKVILFLLYVYFAFIGSVAPDIDMKSSYVSKRYPIISKYISKRLKHRGFTHSILYLILLIFTSDILQIYTDKNLVFSTCSLGFIVGNLSHIVLDIFTKEGVTLFYPVNFKLSLLPLKTNSNAERILSKILNFAIIFFIGYSFYTI